MDNVNFRNQLEHLIEKLKLLQNSELDNPSYEYLINKLSKLSIENVQSKKDLILHFIVDSYDGNIELGNKIVEFLSLYSLKDKNHKVK